MLSFACFVPHSPILIPEVGKENLEKLKDTVSAYQSLENDLYSSKPDIIILISSHANAQEGPYFTINQSPKLTVDFKKFGDLVTKLEFSNEIGFGYKIKESCEDHFSIKLIAEQNIDYGSGVPLLYLAKHLADVKIVNIGYADLSYEDHLEFGRLIRKQINLSPLRIAVVASGDLSHKLHKDSPAGYSKDAQDFDQKIVAMIENKEIDDLLHMDKKMIDDVEECGLRSLLILLGIIKEINYQPKKLSYEAPFGIGYLAANFKIR